MLLWLVVLFRAARVRAGASRLSRRARLLHVLALARGHAGRLVALALGNLVVRLRLRDAVMFLRIRQALVMLVRRHLVLRLLRGGGLRVLRILLALRVLLRLHVLLGLLRIWLGLRERRTAGEHEGGGERDCDWFPHWRDLPVCVSDSRPT